MRLRLLFFYWEKKDRNSQGKVLETLVFFRPCVLRAHERSGKTIIDILSRDFRFSTLPTGLSSRKVSDLFHQRKGPPAPVHDHNIRSGAPVK